MIICDNCEEAKAVTYNDGERVCKACSDIIDEMRVTNPELWQNSDGECITCGAEKCEDALCKEEREAARLAEEADDEWDGPCANDTDDAEALASAGWGTDEDYGYFGGED